MSAARPRMLFVLPDLRGGGAERTAVNLARAVDPERFEVQVGLLERTGDLLREVRAEQIVGVHEGRWRPERDTLARGAQDVLRARAMLHDVRPRVVMTSMPDATIPTYLALRTSRVRPLRFVVREGNNTAVVHRRLGGMTRSLVWSLIRRVYARADAVIVPSNGVADGLVRSFGLRRDAIAVIPNPVRIDEVTRRAKEAPAVALPPRFVVGVGRLVEQKGFDLLLRAVASAPELDGFAVVLLGEGPERPRLAALADRLGLGARLVMPGFLANPWSVVARASLFALPSRWEGFGHVVVEAMAAGTPVVVSDCGYGPSEIVRDGIDGWVHRNEDVTSLRRAIVEAARGDARAERRRTEAHARARAYDAASIARRYAEVLWPPSTSAP